VLRPTEKTALVTHRNCLDGTGSAAIFVIAGGKPENVFFRDPKGCALSPEDAAPFDEVWFVDVCPWFLDDPAGGKPWRVFDHHDTNIRRWEMALNQRTWSPYAGGSMYFDQDRCGTSILAAALSPYEDGYIGASISRLVETIEHYDLGRFDATYHVKQLADMASTYSQRDLLDLLVDRKSEILDLGYYQNRGIAVGDARAIFAENAAKSAFKGEIEFYGRTYSCALVCAPRDWGNDIAERLLSNEKVDISVVVDFSRNAVSLRSRSNGPNVAMIAERYGGGGHPRAAGIRLDSREAYRVLFEGIFG
jgi:oligoribonuclease NrnB/cAMP/cGMP phosphodiesterase (DHH superfamily)